MKKRFSVEQITAMLQQAAQGVPVGDLCRKVGILQVGCVSCATAAAAARRISAAAAERCTPTLRTALRNLHFSHPYLRQ